MCCGEPMQELKANCVDAAVEKHMPVVTVKGKKVNVVVGSAPHPMVEDHYIEFVILVTNLGYKVNYLKPNTEPETNFALANGEKVVACYAFCNLHSLWVKQ